MPGLIAEDVEQAFGGQSACQRFRLRPPFGPPQDIQQDCDGERVV
jgi:hypothetical protein